ncbi:MAG: hypothetical protein B6D41_19830, partial [Chloroflexi bacterium UTCFX4]
MRTSAFILVLFGALALAACANQVTPNAAPPSALTHVSPTATEIFLTATRAPNTLTRASASATRPPSPTPTRTPTATRPPKASPTPDGFPATLEAWQQTIDAIAASGDAQAQVNALWEKLTRAQRIPLTTQ